MLSFSYNIDYSVTGHSKYKDDIFLNQRAVMATTYTTGRERFIFQKFTDAFINIDASLQVKTYLN